MKTDFSQLPREDVEARITMMLMGELATEEARELMDFVTGDSELLRWHDKLKATISLVNDAVADEPAVKISEGKREALLASFKMVRPAELAGRGSGRAPMRTWAALAAMIAFLLAVAGLMLPALSKAKSKGSRVAKQFGAADAISIELPGGGQNAGREIQNGRATQSETEVLRDGAVVESAVEQVQRQPRNSEVDGLGLTEERIADSAVKTPGTPMSYRFYRDEKAGEADANGVASTKIELPAITESGDAAGAKDNRWGFQGGQARGFGTDARRPGSAGRTLGEVLTTPAADPQLMAQNDGTFGKNMEAAAPSQPARPGIEANRFMGRSDYVGPGAAFGFDVVEPGAETKSVDLFVDGDAKKSGGSVDPSTGLPALTEGAAKSRALTADEEVVEGGQAAPAGGAMVSMQYYMSNPELMKRYFPQMYEMMQRGRSQAGGAGEDTGFPGMAGPAAKEDLLKRKSEPAEGVQERNVVLGAEVKLAEPATAPSETVTSRSEEFRGERIETSKKVQDSRILIEQGNIDEAEKLLKEATKIDPQQRAARYYLDLIKEQRYAQQANNSAATGLKDVNQTLESLGRAPVDEQVRVPLVRQIERDPPAKKPVSSAAMPQPEVATVENAFSTFSLNVSDVSFKLAGASLEKGLMPEAGTVRSEEFINAFDYRDPQPLGAPIGFVWERARYPFAQDRDLVRLSVKTAASGREAGRPLNLVLLVDSSGSMERADRVRILRECMRTLAGELRAEDKVSVVGFARTPRLWVDGLAGSQAKELPERAGNLAPEGGTNLEEALKVAYETARKHFSASGVNRVVLLTDGAANLGDVEPESLKRKVEAERSKGIALDCFGIGWEGLNDELLETLSRNGDGRYGFVNSTEAAGSEFAAQLAGALKVAASDVKVQVEWNPKRVTAYRQIGYAKHQLTKEQFRDNTVDAAEIGAAEAGNAMYVVQVNAGGEGALGTVRVRFKVPGTEDYREHAWPLNYEGAVKGLENSSYPLRLAGTAAAFSEWLVSSPYASEVTTDRLLSILSGVPEHFAPDPRPKKLEWMIRQAKSVAGR